VDSVAAAGLGRHVFSVPLADASDRIAAGQGSHGGKKRRRCDVRSLVSTFGVALAVAACSASTGTLPSTATPIPPSTASSPVSPGPTEQIETLRQLAFDYWAAFNVYDKEKVLSFLEESYRTERESRIRSDIGRLSAYSA